MGDITDDQRKMLASYFEQCVVSASGGKKLTPEEKKNATGKAIMKMIEPLMGKSDAAFCEGGVVTKLSDKKTRKMNIDVFTSEFFPALAEYAASNIAAHKKKGTKAEDLKTKYLAAVEKELSKEKKSATNAGVVNRLTDTSKYTGSHKERFNEDGSGKGAGGRKDEVNSSGYVGNYKNEGTYDAKK